MLGLVLVVVLGVTVLVGTTIGGRYRVAPPVLLIVFGALLGLVPQLSDVVLKPDVVLFLFLPAILYWESLNTSLREIRANLRVIVLFSVALVVVTMVVVSVVAQALGVDPAAAWVLGAVLAPTDAAAVAGLAKRLPRRNLTTLRAESLINDGTALVLFAIAVDVGRGGSGPGLLELVARFVGSYAGGIVAGLVVSGGVVLLRRRLDDPLREGALSVLTPFMAFLLADAVHASGVVAVVVAGLVLTYAGPRVIGARSRTQAFAFWDLSTFLLNGGLFVFVGLQIPRVVRGIDSTSTAHALVIAVTVTGVVVGTRLLWVHVVTFILRTLDRRAGQRARRASWRARTLGGWAGFRGAVSLAAALAVPATTRAADPFPDRDLIVFTTSVVILLTIIVQGTTLPAVARWARLPEDTGRLEELQFARTRAAEAGLAALPRVALELGLDGELVERVRAEYEEHADALRAESAEGGLQAMEEREQGRRLRLGVLAHKRLAVTELRDANRIDDIVLREVQAGMDIEEIRLLGPAPTD
ncbi:MAG: Na+/H+ antiporter [Actinomycetota bacterium]|nr:Na+/H+ antiporter [Actinomycetota bacterium]